MVDQKSIGALNDLEIHTVHGQGNLLIPYIHRSSINTSNNQHDTVDLSTSSTVIYIP